MSCFRRSNVLVETIYKRKSCDIRIYAEPWDCLEIVFDKRLSVDLIEMLRKPSVGVLGDNYLKKHINVDFGVEVHD